MEEVCEHVISQAPTSINSVELAAWINQGISFYDYMANLSAEYPVFMGMLLGGCLTQWVRRIYLKK
jgi:esterase/lipase